jgi:hypothetical protein
MNILAKVEYVDAVLVVPLDLREREIVVVVAVIKPRNKGVV